MGREVGNIAQWMELKLCMDPLQLLIAFFVGWIAKVSAEIAPFERRLILDKLLSLFARRPGSHRYGGWARWGRAALPGGRGNRVEKRFYRGHDPVLRHRQIEADVGGLSPVQEGEGEGL